MFISIRIDFDDPSTTRTGNLAKSAVLAALEEEERERQGRKSGENYILNLNSCCVLFCQKLF